MVTFISSMWMEKIIFAADVQVIGSIHMSRYTETVSGKT
jgi:hypothetical protein